MDHHLTRQLTERHAQHLYRSRTVIQGTQGIELVVNGKPVLGFCSNDYLGLANHPAVVAALRRGARDFGTGSGAAHLVCGHYSAHHALEEELAAFTGRPRALLFSTGYMANLALISTLAGTGQTIHQDRFNHASLLDGGRLSGGRVRRYPHLDTVTLEQRLAMAAPTAAPALIVSDGVFSMNGDVAPVPALAVLARRHHTWLIIDDAHGLGVLGSNGGGVLEHFGLDRENVHALVGTLGKAFGVFGAFIAGSEALIETLIQRGRSYIYTTALPPALAQAARVSVQLARVEGWRRDRLHQLITRFRTGAAERELPLLASTTPIQILPVKDSASAVTLTDALLARGILITPIRPPTVPAGGARLRITLSASHNDAQLDYLLDTLTVLMLKTSFRWP